MYTLSVSDLLLKSEDDRCSVLKFKRSINHMMFFCTFSRSLIGSSLRVRRALPFLKNGITSSFAELVSTSSIIVLILDLD